MNLIIHMNFRNNKKKQTKLTSVIISAALQDHLLKKFNYNLDDHPKPRAKEPPRRKTFQKLPSLQSMDKQISKLQHAEKTSILPYQNETLKKLKEERSDEQKMQKYSKQLTWAQRLGIIEAPPLPLTAKDWDKIQQKSKARNDSDNCCSICLQDFKIQPQVILSCSHVFHMKCLNSYQKHNKVHCCPICRRKDYQKKVIDQAIRAWTLKSIIRIQRVFRGSCDRISLYSKIVDSGYKPSSVRFNRRIIGFKMWRLSKKIVDKVKRNEEYYSKMIKQMEQKHQKSKQSILDDIVQVQRKKMQTEGQIQKYLQRFGLGRNLKKQESALNWQQIKMKGVERNEEECSICLMKLWNKPVYLLSCTHIFHVNCIEGFQRYAIPGNQNKCPCCRSHYTKKCLSKKC